MNRNKWVFGLIGGIALALSLVATGAAQTASPNCTSTTMPYNQTLFSPCNGEFITVTGTETITICTSTDSSGVMHASATDVIEATGVGDLGNTYNITGSGGKSHASLNAQGNGEVSVDATLHFVSATAPNFLATETIHGEVSNFTVAKTAHLSIKANCTG